MKNEEYKASDDIVDKLNALIHYGTPRHSGRYPWGSGENPYQRQKDFTSHVKALKQRGMSEVEIAKAMDMSTGQLRAKLSNAKIEMRAAQKAELQRLIDKGYSVNAASKRMDIPESTCRTLLSESSQQRFDKQNATAQMLKDQVEAKGYLDVGKGTEQWLGVSSTKLGNCLDLLKEQGYAVRNVQITQIGTGEKTTIKVLTKDDKTYKDIYDNMDKIRPVADVYLEDDKWRTVEPPRSVSSDRIEINYTQNGRGGVEKDGLIELRPGVDDISLGSAQYAQVRIAVDGTNYLKGMAVYTNDLPEGKDIRYNTNKAPGTPVFHNPDPMGETVFKEMKKDPNNPFGATIKMDDELIRCQRHYKDADGNEQLSAINVVNEEGNWGEWSKTLSSQMLSKQSPSLAQQQLKSAYDQKKEEYDELRSLTNPTVRKYLFEEFADECESAAVSLKGAAIPGTASHVLIPFPDMKENEIYAPNYPDGTRVALIRHPHGGQSEIPILIVNNKYKPAKEMLGAAPDAVGIHPAAAKKLSGADFDGDTALVIPNNDNRVRSRSEKEMSESLANVQNFDPKEAYPGYEGMKVISSKGKQLAMGDVSNLITDMTIKGATDDELARAIRHSMVVIDAEKHKLNYRQSYVDNGIAELKRKYQGVSEDGKHLKGASTIISRASSEEHVPKEKKGQWVVDPETGKGRRLFYDPNTGDRLYEPTGETVVGKDGKEHLKLQTVTRMSRAKDAYELTSGGSKEKTDNKMEAVYADHANALKNLAREARKTMLATDDIEYNPTAYKVYHAEVASLRAKLNEVKKNAPLERQAQLLAARNIKSIIESNPDIKEDKDKLKKLKGQSLRDARMRVNPARYKDRKKWRSSVDITDREWEAIQSGAVSKSLLRDVLGHSDSAKVKQRAMPRTYKRMSAAQTSRAKSMLARGHSQASVAEALGVSVSTLMRNINGNSED